jgi:hypothetical protein
MTGTPGGGDNVHNRRVVEVKTPGNSSQTFAVDVPSTDNLADLMGRQFWLATQLDPISDSACSAFAPVIDGSDCTRK